MVHCVDIVTDHSRGPGRAIGPACVCISVSVCPALTFELNDILPRNLARRFTFIITKSISKVKVTGQSSRSPDETGAQQLPRWPTVA